MNHTASDKNETKFQLSLFLFFCCFHKLTSIASKKIIQNRFSMDLCISRSHWPLWLKHILISPNFLSLFTYYIVGPAPEANTNEIFSRTQSIKSYKICHDITVDLSTIGSQTWEVEGRTFTVTIKDSVEDYAQLMREIFDFDLLKKLINGTDDQPPFKFVASAMHGGEFCTLNFQLLYRNLA